MRHDVRMTIGRRQSAGSMQQQSLFGTGMDAPVQIHRLFFAVFPDEAARHAIVQVAEDLRSKRMVRGRWIDPSRYHVTLHFLGDNAELRQDLVDRAKAAAMKVVLSACVLSLDRLASFHGRKPPGVLRCADGTTPVHALWQALRRELMHAGLGAVLEPDFTPHVTLFYSDGAMLEPAAIEPIAWTVREFVLVHSVVGQKDYRILARWMLSD
jgi:2'-5' RNA ligase